MAEVVEEAGSLQLLQEAQKFQSRVARKWCQFQPEDAAEVVDVEGHLLNQT